jgi:hypothetical protein
MDAKQAAAVDFEHELETWDWARTAGVSVEELRQALLASPSAPEPCRAA